MNYNLKNNIKYYKVISLFIIFTCALFVRIFLNQDITNNTANFDYKRVVVQEGDTLWSLAKKLNKEFETNKIVETTIKFNNLHNTYLQPGQEIYIPVYIQIKE